jgi:hypothetical protein
MPNRGRKPLSSIQPPHISVPTKPRLPTGGNVRSPNAPAPTKPSKPKTPNEPTVKPNKPPSVDPHPTKPPSMLDRAGGALGGLASGAGMIGLGAMAGGGMGGGLGGLFGQGIQTAGNVAIAGKGIDAVKDVINNITDDITKNPMNLAIVVGILGVLLIGIPKFK